MDVNPSDNNQRISGSGQKNVQSPLSKDTLKRSKKEGSTVSTSQTGDVLETSSVLGAKKEAGALPVTAASSLYDPTERESVLAETKNQILEQSESALEAQAGTNGRALLTKLFE
jgi:hypothetical protein